MEEKRNNKKMKPTIREIRGKKDMRENREM
jgi:hypothetical protein